MVNVLTKQIECWKCGGEGVIEYDTYMTETENGAAIMGSDKCGNCAGSGVEQVEIETCACCDQDAEECGCPQGEEDTCFDCGRCSKHCPCGDGRDEYADNQYDCMIEEAMDEA